MRGQVPNDGRRQNPPTRAGTPDGSAYDEDEDGGIDDVGCPPVVLQLANKLKARQRGGRSLLESSRKWDHQLELPLSNKAASVDDFYGHRLVVWDPIAVWPEYFEGLDVLPCPR